LVAFRKVNEVENDRSRADAQAGKRTRKYIAAAEFLPGLEDAKKGK
jgi:hypothetical protein